MNHRERVLTAMKHREPDRVPLFYRDVPEVDERLRRDLGLRGREALLEYFDIDFRWVGPAYVGPETSQVSKTCEVCEVSRDIWGTEYRYTVAGHGGYWEPIGSPLAGVTEIAALDAHTWPSVEWFDFSALDEGLKCYAGYATMTDPGFSSPGVLATIQNLLGMERALADMLLRPDFYQALIDRIMAFNLAFLERYFDVAGNRLDFFRIGDDFGTQQGLLISPRSWRRFFMPTQIAMSAIAKRHGAYYYHHCCGAVRAMIPLFVEAGVDVLDPVQVKAAGMEPAALKADFGSRICFSGGVDEQELLPRGTPDEVRAGVRSLLDVMAPAGGYFVGPTHNFQADIPTANIVAMYEAAREWQYQ